MCRDYIKRYNKDDSIRDSNVSAMVQTAGLKYYDKLNKKWASVTLAPDIVAYLAELGRLRFDTKLIRNITWLVQLQRIMRVVLIGHLSWINTPVVRGLRIADPKITEYEGDDSFNPNEFNNNEYELI